RYSGSSPIPRFVQEEVTLSWGASHLVRDASPGRELLTTQHVMSLRKAHYSDIGDFVSHPNDQAQWPRPWQTLTSRKRWVAPQSAAALSLGVALAFSVRFGTISMYPLPARQLPPTGPSISCRTFRTG